nr:hypothetical protein [Tanacetum cinerariifolium]
FVKNQSLAIYTTGWTWKFVRCLTDDQLRIEYDKICRAVDLATAKDQHQHLKRSGETLESLESKKLKSSHSTSQPAELQETTSVSAGATITAGDPIPAITFVSKGFSVSASSSIPAATPIAAGVSTTAGASGSTSEASVPVIELFDSPPKDTSLPLDPKTDDLDKPLRKSLRKKSIARKRTLPSPSKPKSDALPFDEDDPEVAFKRADGTVKRFSTPSKLMYWAGRADLMVLYGLVLDKYKTERATGIGLGLWMDLRTLITAREERDASIIWDDHDQWQIRSWRFYAIPTIHVLETEAGDIMYMFVDKKYPLTPATLQRMLNHGLKIDRDPSDYLPFSILLVHQRFNTALMTIWEEGSAGTVGPAAIEILTEVSPPAESTPSAESSPPVEFSPPAESSPPAEFSPPAESSPPAGISVSVLRSHTKELKNEVSIKKEEYKDFIQETVANEVKNKLSKILPKAVSDFATLVIQSTINETLDQTPVVSAKSSYAIAESLTEFKLKKIIMKKMKKKTKKRRTGKDAESLNKSSTPKESTKGKPSSKSSKTGKSAFADQSVKEPEHEISKKDWFKDSPKPEVRDPEWNTIKTIDDTPEQPWFNKMVQAVKPPLTFDELMSTPIDFFSICYEPSPDRQYHKRNSHVSNV